MSDFQFILPTVGGVPISVDTLLPLGQIDHVATALNRFCQEFKDKTGITDLLSIYAQRFNDLEVVFQALLAQRFNVYNATGAMLDLVGKLVGQPRNGMLDVDYRRFIFARIARDRSDGTIEDLISVAKLILNNLVAYIWIDRQGVAAVVVRILKLACSDTTANLLVDFLQPTALAGVRVIVETQYEGHDTTLNGTVTVGANAAVVVSTTGWPASGTADIDRGLATFETVTYTSLSPTALLGFATTCTQNHSSGASVVCTSDIASDLSEQWEFGQCAFLTLLSTIGATALAVDSTAGFPTNGSLNIDDALTTAETVTYTGTTPTAFLGVSACTKAHAIGACCTSASLPGLGMGDTSTPITGGEMCSARDKHYP